MPDVFRNCYIDSFVLFVCFFFLFFLFCFFFCFLFFFRKLAVGKIASYPAKQTMHAVCARRPETF